MAEGRAAAALARFDQINRELADRQALRERKAAEAKQRASENLARRGEVAERSAKHLIELAKRQRANSGFDTGRSREDEEHVLQFDVEDEEVATDRAAYPAERPNYTAERPNYTAERPTYAAERSTQHPAPPQAEPAAPSAPQAQPVRRASPAYDEDDEDFSNETYLK
ncbi:hypothetical protein FB384_001006 [Prauserella sediminis]|uniref:Uncharacterized protein n=1 Tax=Prauserella sediminis TaxID=577680 RepID=A0A839XDT3_9PSEU|nr:hypothetical protein [Prauserella sediminis]MBB3662102.1 hypothetical protein [Prauserella sediminis]